MNDVFLILFNWLCSYSLKSGVRFCRWVCCVWWLTYGNGGWPHVILAYGGHSGSSSSHSFTTAWMHRVASGARLWLMNLVSPQHKSLFFVVVRLFSFVHLSNPLSSFSLPLSSHSPPLPFPWRQRRVERIEEHIRRRRILWKNGKKQEKWIRRKREER